MLLSNTNVATYDLDAPRAAVLLKSPIIIISYIQLLAIYTTNQLQVLVLVVALQIVTLQPIYYSYISYQMARVPVPMVPVVGAPGVLVLD